MRRAGKRASAARRLRPPHRRRGTSGPGAAALQPRARPAGAARPGALRPPGPPRRASLRGPCPALRAGGRAGGAALGPMHCAREDVCPHARLHSCFYAAALDSCGARRPLPAGRVTASGGRVRWGCAPLQPGKRCGGVALRCGCRGCARGSRTVRSGAPLRPRPRGARSVGSADPRGGRAPDPVYLEGASYSLD